MQDARDEGRADQEIDKRLVKLLEEALPSGCAAPRTDDVEAVFLLPPQHHCVSEALLAVRVEKLYDFGGAELMPACRCINGRWWRGGWHAVGLE
jgi:hypothetical protein